MINAQVPHRERTVVLGWFALRGLEIESPVVFMVHPRARNVRSLRLKLSRAARVR